MKLYYNIKHSDNHVIITHDSGNHVNCNVIMEIKIRLL